MIKTAAQKHTLRAAGYFAISIVSGLAVYTTPPESWQQLGTWLWQPALQGLLAALMSLGLNQVVETPR
jgi:uncharacterized membrane protein